MRAFVNEVGMPDYMYLILASAEEYQPFLKGLPKGGPIMNTLMALLIVSFIYGGIRAWKGGPLTPGTVLAIYTPTLLGCALAACQSIVAEHRVRGGLIYWHNAERYVGHIRIYLAIGVIMSAVI